MVSRADIGAWFADAIQKVQKRVFVDFVKADAYPRQVGVLIDRDEHGRWSAQQVARWDDASEAECRYGELPIGHWDRLVWVS